MLGTSEKIPIASFVDLCRSFCISVVNWLWLIEERNRITLLTRAIALLLIPFAQLLKQKTFKIYFKGNIIVIMYLCAAEKFCVLGNSLLNTSVSWMCQELHLLFVFTRASVPKMIFRPQLLRFMQVHFV